MAKSKGLPVVMSAKQVKAAEKRAAKAELAEQSKRLAQIVNLHIAGYSLAEIGASIGATAAEVDQMLSQDMARYVRSQPALRVYVRNYVSQKYTELLEANWDTATDKQHPDKLENQDRAIKILDRMTKLHGANAPEQSEIKVEAVPQTVDNMVKRLAAAQGLGYDTGIFDVVDAEEVHEVAGEALAELESASQAVAEPQEGDEGL